jgi:AraC family cel operon transcriptional repressor
MQPAKTEQSITSLMRNIVLPAVEGHQGQIIFSEEDSTSPGRDSNEMIDGCMQIYPFKLHNHDSFQWVWVLDNYTHIQIGNTTHRLAAGDFCLLPPRVNHVEMFTPATPAYRSLWFTYQDRGVCAWLFTYKPVNQGETVAYALAPAPLSIATLLSLLQTELRTTEPYSFQIRHSLLSTLAHTLMRCFESVVHEDPNTVLPGLVAHRVISYMHQNYAQEISLDDIARDAGRSRNYLTSVFKRETGKTIWEALTDIRIEHAKFLLIERKMSIHEIANAVGYPSPEHFCRIFQRREGVPPSLYGK